MCWQCGPIISHHDNQPSNHQAYMHAWWKHYYYCRHHVDPQVPPSITLLNGQLIFSPLFRSKPENIHGTYCSHRGTWIHPSVMIKVSGITWPPLTPDIVKIDLDWRRIDIRLTSDRHRIDIRSTSDRRQIDMGSTSDRPQIDIGSISNRHPTSNRHWIDIWLTLDRHWIDNRSTPDWRRSQVSLDDLSKNKAQRKLTHALSM